MGEVFRARLRRIGSSAGILIPKERLKEVEAEPGDEIEVAILVHKKPEELDRLFGFAKGAGPFIRDKKVREFK